VATPPELVWRLLTDLELYPAWNPFIVSAQGRAECGAFLALRLQPGQGRLWRQRARITHCSAPRELGWRRRRLVAGLLERRHLIHLRPEAGGTHVHQRVEWRGLLASFVPAARLEAVGLGLQAMNEALKQRAERLLGPPAREPEEVEP
jgi:hypothetical protein